MVPNPFLAFPFKSIHLSSSLLWALLGAYFFFYCILSLVLTFHWREYGMNAKTIIFVELLFYGISIFLFLMASTVIVAL